MMIFLLDYREITRLQQSCELIDEFIVQVGHGHSTHKLIHVATGQVEDTKPKNNTTDDHKPSNSDCCTGEKETSCHGSEYLTVLPAYIRYSDLLMDLRRHHSMDTATTKATTTSLLVCHELKGNSYHSIHPIILHDHNYI